MGKKKKTTADQAHNKRSANPKKNSKYPHHKITGKKSNKELKHTKMSHLDDPVFIK